MYFFLLIPKLEMLILLSMLHTDSRMLRLEFRIGVFIFLICTRNKDCSLCYRLVIKLEELEITYVISILKDHPKTSAEKLFQNLILLIIRNVLNFNPKFIHSSSPSLVIAISLPAYLQASIIILERTLCRAIRRNMPQ